MSLAPQDPFEPAQPNAEVRPPEQVEPPEPFESMAAPAPAPERVTQPDALVEAVSQPEAFEVLEGNETIEAVETVEDGAAVEPTAPARRPHIVALLNQKGGVGKTTSTVNLGAALARYGQRVLLIDLDPQSNLSLHFGAEPEPEQASVHDLLMDESVRVEDVVVNARPGLDFIPAVTELALVESELAARPDMQGTLRRKLEPVFGRYDVILLDCPPSLGVLSVNALTVASEVFVPMQAHYLPLRGLEKLLQTVHLVSQGLNPTIRVSGVLLCIHEGLSSHARAVIDEIETQLTQFRGTDLPWADARVLAPPVRRNIKLAEAPSFGQTIFDYAPRCPGADDYRRLAASLLEGWGIEPPEFELKRARRADRPERSVRRKKRKPAADRKPAKAATPAKRVKPTKHAKPTKSTKSAATAKQTAATKPTKSTKPAKSTTATKPTKATKSTKFAQASRATTQSRATVTSRTAKKTVRKAPRIVESKPSKLVKPTNLAKLAKLGKPTKSKKAAMPGKIRRGTAHRARRSIRSGGLSL